MLPIESTTSWKQAGHQGCAADTKTRFGLGAGDNRRTSFPSGRGCDPTGPPAYRPTGPGLPGPSQRERCSREQAGTGFTPRHLGVVQTVSSAFRLLVHSEYVSRPPDPSPLCAPAGVGPATSMGHGCRRRLQHHVADRFESDRAAAQGRGTGVREASSAVMESWGENTRKWDPLPHEDAGASDCDGVVRADVSREASSVHRRFRRTVTVHLGLLPPTGHALLTARFLSPRARITPG